MSHLEFYQVQAEARGIRCLADVVQHARNTAYIYDRVVLPWLPKDRTKPIVELGCGHGAFLWWLQERGFTQVTGLDVSPTQVALARQVGVPVQQAELTQWLAAQPQGSVAVLVAIDLIEHLSKDAFTDLLRHSCRVLEPGGRLILRYPNGDSPLVGLNLFNDITHIWTYTTNCLRTLARLHGFVAVQFVDQGTVIRDCRWLKVPLAKLARAALRLWMWAATREHVHYWGPHLWACLER
jgi:cyclopropane fatty-acyl-phospholipid synthase-like methyltransferase